jgi:subtilisin family serine protease
MKLDLRILGVGLFVTLFALAVPGQTEWVWYGKHRVHPTRLLARYAEDSSSSVRLSLLSEQNETVIRTYGLVPGLVVLEPDGGQAVTAEKQKSTGHLLRKRIANLMATGAFKYVEPDYQVKALLTPNDARFVDGTLWGLRNTGQNGGVAGADINAVAAWDITTGSSNVVVAVIDTGIRYTHQELASRMWTNPGEVAGNGVDDDNDGYIDNVHGINAINGTGNPADDNDHGTHVAGTIGAAANDGNPHVGVAWNVRLMACKFLGADGSGTTSDAIECINFAVTNGAKVLNNSWGGGPFEQALYDAIVNSRNQGVLFVAAAGNESNDNDASPSYPASYSVDNIIAVAALDRSDNLASFSNYGHNSVHLGAPGVAIFSSTSGANNEYQTFNGTSMATPHVSGVAALILSQFPAVSLTELRQRITQSAVPVAALNGITQTGGRLNAFNALTITQDNVLEVTVTSPQGTTVAAGSTVPVFVKVTDLNAVTNATVTGSTSNQPGILFSNSGNPPDQTASDAIYSANVQVPTNGNSFTLNLQISAPGKTSSTNAVVFAIIQPPPNDAFTNAIVLDSGGGTVNGTSRNATREAVEPVHCEVGGGKSVWWRWTAPQNQITTISTLGSGFDTVLAVYKGNSVGALTNVVCNDEVPAGFFTSEVIFQAVAGTTYRIAVDGYIGDEGDIVLTLSQAPAITNDNFASRTPINGVNQIIRSSNFGATVEGPEPFHCGNAGGASVWWSWIAPSNVSVILSTAGSTYDTILAVYTGSSLGGLSGVTCNDDHLPPFVLVSEVSFNATAGTTYQIAVEGYGNGFVAAVGSLTLSLVTVPSNNSFANRAPMNGAFAQASGYNIGATHQSGEPDHCDVGGTQSVWWTWTAPHSGNASLTAAGSSYDTALAVYTGNTVAGLTEVACNDDEDFPVLVTSKVTFPATVGTTYQFAVDGFLYTDFFGSPIGTDAGLISLTLSLDGKSQLSDVKRRQDGYFQFTLKGESGRQYTIEASGDLKTWSPIGEVFLFGNSTIFVDTTFTGQSRRFYRALPAALIE